MIAAALGIKALNTVLFVIGLAIGILAILVLVLSAVLGIRKGGAAAGWKLFWRVISILTAVGITVLLGRMISPVFASVSAKLAVKVLPKKLLPFLSGNKVISGILVSFALPFVFLIVLLVVSLLFLIPKILIWNKAIAPAYSKYHDKKPENTAVSGVLGALLNCMAAMLLFFSIVMPVACFAARTNDVLDAANDAGLTNVRLSSLSSPAYTVCDAVMGKVVYEPLTSFRTAFGSTDIFSEAQYSLNIYKYLKEPGNYEKSVRKANKNFRKSELLPDILSDIILAVSNEESDIMDALGTRTDIVSEAVDSIRDTYEGVSKSKMRGDANALFSVLARMQASGFLSAKDSKARSAAVDILLSEDSVEDLCGDLYESDRAVEITEDIANTFYNQYMSKMLEGTDVTFTQNPFNLTELSKKEAAREITNIISSLNNLNNFTETLNAYNSEKDKGNSPFVGNIDMESLGKALDIMKNSSVLSDCYEDLLNAAENALPSGTGSSSEIDVQKLIESAKNAESSQSYLGSVQGIAGLGETLANKTLGETVRSERLTESVDTLINNIDYGTSQQIGEDIASVLNVENNPQAVDFISEYTKQIAKEKEANEKNPFVQTNLDAEKDALALDAIYELLDRSNGTSLNVSDSELSGYVKTIADSNMIAKTMKTYADQGETLGLAEALSERNKVVITESLQSSDVPEENRQAALDFLRFNDF